MTVEFVTFLSRLAAPRVGRPSSGEQSNGTASHQTENNVLGVLKIRDGPLHSSSLVERFVHLPVQTLHQRAAIRGLLNATATE